MATGKMELEEKLSLAAAHVKLITIGEECIRAINQPGGCPWIITIGHLPIKGWPRGKCIGSDARGKVYAYDARRVLAKIISLGVMTVQFDGWPEEE